jgi:hypothetical protein
MAAPSALQPKTNIKLAVIKKCLVIFVWRNVLNVSDLLTRLGLLIMSANSDTKRLHVCREGNTLVSHILPASS